MFGQTEDLFSGDCINAAFQGCFDRRQFEQEQRLTGTGLLLDDEFNMFLSQWKQNKLNGPSFLRLISGHMVYGLFKCNAPAGVLVIEFQQYRMFLCGSRDVNGMVSWKREAVIINNHANLFYLLELQQRGNEVDMDCTQKISSQSSRMDRTKVIWKIKIADRCQLKQNGKLAGFSKLIKSRESLGKQMDYFKAQFSQREQNYIYLLSIVLGNAYAQPYLISPANYLKRMANLNKKWMVQEFRENQESRDDWLFVGMAYERNGGSKYLDKKLGLLMSSSFSFVKSLGSYNKRMRLNGLGIQFSRRSQCSIGIFREDLLVKQYVSGSMVGEGVSTYPMREILVQQHLRSLNYIHHCHYVSELPEIVSLSNKIVKYVGAFEREYEKRHYNYNDTMAEHSTSSDVMNVMKYEAEDDRKKFDFADEVNSEQFSESGRRDSKKPGFIVKKDINKSKEKEFSKSPQGRSSPKAKSPLRPIRITGRISTNYSPSEKKPVSPLKQNASTIRRGGY